MTQQFKDQGGAASSNPSRLTRWIGSKLMTKVANLESQQQKRHKAEKRRQKRGRPHRVEFYYQVNDAYSHLAAQTLIPLLQSYEIELVPYLAAPPSGANAPEPELLLDYSLRDSLAVALHYSLSFPTDAQLPKNDQLNLASAILAALSPSDFPQAVVEVGDALWSGNHAKLEALAKRLGKAEPASTKAAVDKGTQRRHELKHYSGAMFYYEGEWYWGVDRLYHLENRLIELGLHKSNSAERVMPRPDIDFGENKDDGSLTLEFYPSLRSPYTSIIYDRTIQLVRDSGVKLVMRPVIPMVMRGVSVSMQKGFYIFSDAAREARTLGLDWGDYYDPIGDPIRRAFSLYPWAREQGKEIEFISAFLKAAFFDAVNTNKDTGLKQVVDKSGLSWAEALKIIDNKDWEAELEENRLAMLGLGIWGVPSYHLFDQNGQEVLSAWGQDRLWLVAREIKRLLES
jgi:2-hydroxychromene-2-carboxylate isomerase